MSLAYWCVLVAAVLPYVTLTVSKARKTYNNRDPRAPGLYTGMAYRASSAHQNGLEGFPFFAVAVIVASHASSQVAVAPLDGLAALWVVLRLGYTAAYLFDRPGARSAIWIVSLLVTVAIFTLPAWRG